jgi:hypothetical protein
MAGEEEVKDGTEKVIDPTPDDDKAKDVKKDDDKGALPDVGKKTAEKTHAVQSVLDEYDIDSPEQLGEFLKNLSGLKDQLGDVDLEELKENSALLKKYQKHWAKEEADKREDGETPEETISRLKKENAVIEGELFDDRQMHEDAADAKNQLKVFGSTVKATIEADKAVPAEYRPFLGEFLGVNNEINEVSLDDKAGVKKIAKASAKKLLDFEQLVIKRYLKGKTETPKISTSTETPSEGPVKFKTMKQAKAAMVDRLKAAIKK